MRVIVRWGVIAAIGGCSAGEPALPNTQPLSRAGMLADAPAYSPDGSRIAWWSPADSGTDIQLWVATADMSNPAALPVTAFDPPSFYQPVWSPDGKRIAAVSSQFGRASVILVPAAGGQVERITKGAGLQFPLAWFPDGIRLAYGATDRAGIAAFVVDTRSGTTVPLVPNEKRAYAGFPSPDGKHVVYRVRDGARTTLWVADSAGGDPRQLTTEGFEDVDAWSPDSREILYESRRTGTTDLWVAPISGEKPRQLTRDVRNDYAGTWSPDGKWVAFISDRGRQSDVWLVPAAGGPEQRVTDSPADKHSPLTWRPGSSQLAFVTENYKNGAWAIDVASGVERRLTPDSIRIASFSLAPDGKSVLVVIDRGGGIQNLAVVPLAGGPLRTLVGDGGSLWFTVWSPDALKIAFVSDRGGSDDIWVVDAAGGTPRQLVNWPGSEQFPAWSADGRAVWFISDRESSLGDVWSVPVAGGEPKRITRLGTVTNVLLSRHGVPYFFAGVLGENGGKAGIIRIAPNGKVNTVWDHGNAFVADISPSGDSVNSVVEQPNGEERRMLLAADGSGGRVILKPGERVGNWSSDGKKMTYIPIVHGAGDLAIMDLKTGATRRLTNTPGDETRDAVWSPDDKTIVFQRYEPTRRIMVVDLSRLVAKKQ